MPSTFENRVEALTQIDITSTSAPSQTQLTQFLKDGANDVIDKVIAIKPQDTAKFSKETVDSNNSGIVVKGAILNVARKNGSADDIRPATVIDANNRYLATKKGSMHYRSAYNPGFYILNTRLFVIPPPKDASTQVMLSQINYPDFDYNDSSIGDNNEVATGVTATLATPTTLTSANHRFSNGDVVRLSEFTEATELNGITAIVENVNPNDFQLDGVYVDGAAETTGGRVETVNGGFPNEYEYLVVLYASAMSCMAAASNIQKNMPTKVVKMNPPSLVVDDVNLPTPPAYVVSALEFDMSQVNAKLNAEDMEMAEKEMDKLGKNIDKMKAIGEENAKIYGKELEVYKSTLDNATKNADRKTQQLATEYRSDLYRHQQEVAQYQAELQESMTKYKWYVEQYMSLMSQYNNAFGATAPQQPKGEEDGG